MHGKRIVREVPGGVANREVAQQYENDLKLKMLKGEIGIARTDPDLSSLIKEYLAFSKTNKAPSSYSRDEIDVLLPTLSPAYYPVIYTFLKTGLRKNNLITNLKRAAKKAGIKKNVTVHMLRHTYASHLVMAGVDLPTVKTLLGHADIHTTMRYAHLAPDHLRQAAEKLSF